MRRYRCSAVSRLNDVSLGGPPVLVAYDAAWPLVAAALIDELQAVYPRDWEFEHIGSTSVPGLSAKPIIDLQAQVMELPSYEALNATIGPLGYARSLGSRPDSPGVARDIPRGSFAVSDDVRSSCMYDAKIRVQLVHGVVPGLVAR